MKKIYIASIAHLALAALSDFAGEQNVIHEFDQLPDAQKDGLIAGVDMLIANKDAGADARHNAWMENMLADGWKFSKKRSDEAKTHPRLVPFDQLPKKEIAKEKLLHAIVRAMESSDIPSVSVASVPKPASAAGTVPIKYIGKKSEHKDNLYGTGLEWKPGEVHKVPAAAAAKMLAHTDTYEQDGNAVAGGVAVVEQKSDGQDDMQAPLPQLSVMDKNELINFAQQHFGENLAPDMPEADMRSTVFSLVQARGL